MSVNKERVQLLVDALRSGEYVQGRSMLRTLDDTYCCLGVACDVARLNGVSIEWEKTRSGCDCGDCPESSWTFDGSGEALRRRVAEWYGFHIKDNGMYADPIIGKLDNTTVSMIQANDDFSWDFNMIADAVEATFLTEGDK